MADYDPTDFVDTDFQAHKTPQAVTTTTVTVGGALRAPTREEVDSRVVEAHQKLAELKRAQEELERERATLEETRRRRIEFETGRQELIHNLTRGLGLLEEAEFTARRDADQMAKALADLRDALGKIEAVREETWTKDNFSVELTRALTAVENARMEWNSARLKFPMLSGDSATPGRSGSPAGVPEPASFAQLGFGQWCKLGLAFTLPIILTVLVSAGAVLAILFLR
jgi:hypothetical protein